MATVNEPLLDLRTVTGKFHIRIDGVPHFLSHPDALTLHKWAQIEAISPRIAALTLMVTGGGEVSDADERELSALLERAVRLVLDAPEVVHEKLDDVARASIFSAFCRLRSAGRETGATATARSKTIGARSSRGSKGSTAELPKAG